MTAPRKVSRQQLRKEPHIVWNEFIRLLGKSDYRDLSEIQRVAQLVYNYESEVQNGGHSLYFQTLPIERVREAIAALRLLGANCQANVLARAGARFDSTPRVTTESDDDYVERAVDEELYFCWIAISTSASRTSSRSWKPSWPRTNPSLWW